jgi:hypothetical protein
MEECKKTWELIYLKYIETSILIPLKWDVKFHVHTNASLIDVGALMEHNIIGKNDRPIVYASRLLNNVEHNYSTTKREA